MIKTVESLKIFYKKLDKTLFYGVILYVCLNFGIIYLVSEYPEVLALFNYVN